MTSKNHPGFRAKPARRVFFELDNVGVRIARKQIVSAVSARLSTGSITALVGPNGSGKSTLISALSGNRAFSGSIRVDGRPLATLSRRERVAKLSLVAQNERVDTDLTVRQIVELGVVVGHGAFASMSHAEETAVSEAIGGAGLSGLSDRRWNSLSGGEQQRTQLARAMAQGAESLILDEPTNHLDIHHRIRLLRHLEEHAHEHGACIVIALHDLDLAARFADQVLVLREGRIRIQGTPEEALTPTILEQVFGIRARLRAQGKAISLEIDDAVQGWAAR